MTETMTPKERNAYMDKRYTLEAHIDHIWECVRMVQFLNEKHGIKIPAQYKLRLKSIVEVAQEIIERNPLEDG